MSRLIFSHCHACAQNDQGEEGHDPGVGCPASGPSDGCEGVWVKATDPATAALAGDWSEYEDEISDAISDSIDMDWTSRDGAKAVIRFLARLVDRLPDGSEVNP